MSLNNNMYFDSKIFIKFATSHIHKGKPTACQNNVAGFFCACTIIICGSVLSGKSYDLLPLWVCDNGKGWAVLLFPAYHLNKSVMSHTENDVCTCKVCGKPKVPTTKELLTEFFKEETAQSIEKELWNCFITALGSSDLDAWTAIDRSNLAFMYKKIIVFINQLESIHLKNTA